MLRNKNKYSYSFIIGLLLIIGGIAIITYNYFDKKKFESFDKMNISLMETEIPDNIDNDSDIPNHNDSIDEPNQDDPLVDDSVVVEKPKPIDYSKYYVGTLEIPKINLKKGF